MITYPFVLPHVYSSLLFFLPLPFSFLFLLLFRFYFYFSRPVFPLFLFLRYDLIRFNCSFISPLIGLHPLRYMPMTMTALELMTNFSFWNERTGIYRPWID
jgi:hypothetical protein